MHLSYSKGCDFCIAIDINIKHHCTKVQNEVHIEIQFMYDCIRVNIRSFKADNTNLRVKVHSWKGTRST